MKFSFYEQFSGLFAYCSYFFAAELGKVYEFQTVTAFESIIPNGLGRFRMISANQNKDFKDLPLPVPRKIMDVIHRSGRDDENGIYVTRYIFKRLKN